MTFKSMGSFTSQRDLTTLGLFACSFAALLLFHMHVWGIVIIAALFIGYLSWATTAFLFRQHALNTRSIGAWILPVGMAIFKVLGCFGLVWAVVWSGRRLFGL